VLTRTGRAYEVIGVAKKGKYLTLGAAPKPFIYFPLQQSDARAMTVLARGKGNPTTFLHEVRDAVRAMDNTVPLFNVTTMSEHVDVALAPARSGATVLNVVGLVALVLASLGLYGTMAHTVSRRTYEIGVRRALGAEDRDVIWLVVRQAMLLVLLGLAGGVSLSFAGSRLLGSLLYGVKASDPLVFGLAPVVLVVVCVIASSVPSYRAIGIDASKALRHE
jgi:ABC-type antimicrobial peptide transport system permease subunit